MWQSGQARVSVGRRVAWRGLCVVSVRVARALRCREVVVHEQDARHFLSYKEIRRR